MLYHILSCQSDTCICADRWFLRLLFIRLGVHWSACTTPIPLLSQGILISAGLAIGRRIDVLLKLVGGVVVTARMGRYMCMHGGCDI